MLYSDVLGSRVLGLREIIRDGFDESPAQVQGFVMRVLRRNTGYGASYVSLYRQRTVEDYLQAVQFVGYPALARAGYSLACRGGVPIEAHLTDRFMQCIDQQRSRPAERRAELASDTLALVGLADGLRSIAKWGQPNAPQLESAKTWTRSLLEQHGEQDVSMSRVRLLASDLLEEQGRFGPSLAQSTDVRAAALDLCLWQSWKDMLRNVKHPSTERRRDLFKALLTERPPSRGDLLHAASWLCALDVLTANMAAVVVPDEHEVTRILADTQGSFRRWPWETAATRGGRVAVQWLIDKESDVQAFLLAVLYPYFGDQLEDEQYLQGFGLRQGRFDFAISSLRLIIEVKVMRRPRDVKHIETQIVDDLALYFNGTSPFTKMIVYVYDDTDRPEPERYPAIRDTLKKRSNRIIDVVVVQRPSMIPNRDKRK